MTAWASVRDRIHSSSSNIFVCGVLFMNMCCALSGKRLFRDVSSGPLDCEDVQDSEEPPPLTVSCQDAPV